MINREKPFIPLRIRAWLRCGVISDEFLPLDAIIYYQAVREKYGEQDYSRSGQGVIHEGGDIVLPFSKVNQDSEAWFYACSFAQWSRPMALGNEAYSKRFDLAKSIDFVDFGNKVGKVDTMRGRYKNYRNDVYYRHALYVDWYAKGDKEEIERLLSFCTHIGKKASQGWGEVIRWEVVEWHESWAIRDAQNRLMRAVPIESSRTKYVYGIRPSYWLPKHQFPVVMPLQNYTD